jgi:hypothetical protein
MCLNKKEKKMSIRNQGLQVDQVALLGVALAVLVTITTADGKFDWFDTIAGIISFLILNSFDLRDDQVLLFQSSLWSWSRRRIWFQKAVFGAVWALCVIVSFGVFLNALQSFVIFLLWLVIAVGCIIVREWIIVANKRRTNQPSVSPPSVNTPPVSNTQTGTP